MENDVTLANIAISMQVCFHIYNVGNLILPDMDLHYIRTYSFNFPESYTYKIQLLIKTESVM